MSIFKKKGTVESLFRMGEGAEGGKGSLHQTPLVQKRSSLLPPQTSSRQRHSTKGWAARLPSWSHA